MHSKYLVLILTGTAFVSLLFSQEFNARGIAMGQAYGAVARGVDATNWNPANLMATLPITVCV
jgi:hypothetical protein